ncbi:MAG: DUF3108 domain-containing protein [Rhodobacteraceae bacterium]|nr:DUF3108 domain-containing protein [Paracoccaceae bacterium]MYF46199.1 DUF3108 domain-containing protein [Paracoccaceae bacterium]MYI91882.1 DUF3108 domain-containing protein [Paracoccaceae bacterium]
MKKLLISILIVISLIATITNADEIREERAEYYISLLGFRIGYMVLASKTKGNLYAATSLVGSTGVGNFFGKMKFKARIRGRIEGKNVIPTHYHLESTKDGVTTTKTLTFKDGNVIQDEGTRQSDSGIDYLSGFFVVMRDTLEEELCGFSYTLADEQRVAEVIIGNPVRLRSGKYKCYSEYVRKSGYSEDEMSKPSFKFELYYEPSPKVANYYQLQKMILHSRFGRMRVLRSN